MWFLVVTQKLSCFSAFADLHGLSSLTCCFYEYIRADACCESIWLGYTAARHFFSLQLLEDKFWKVTRVNLRSLAPTSILISIWTSVLQLVLLYNDDFLLSIYIYIYIYIFCDSGLVLIQYSQLSLSPHDNCFGYSCDPELQPLITGMLLALLNHAVHFRLDCFELILPKGFLIGVSAFVFVV